jgi:hypothetical protein
MRDARLVAAAEKAAAFFNGKDGFGNTGRLNIYTCDHDERHAVVTVDREPGVTPFTIECPHCKAEGTLGTGFYRHPPMTSSFYRVPADSQPTHEWYRPDSLESFAPGTVDHLLKGGLVLREIAKATT